MQEKKSQTSATPSNSSWSPPGAIGMEDTLSPPLGINESPEESDAEDFEVRIFFEHFTQSHHRLP